MWARAVKEAVGFNLGVHKVLVDNQPVQSLGDCEKVFSSYEIVGGDAVSIRFSGFSDRAGCYEFLSGSPMTLEKVDV